MLKNLISICVLIGMIVGALSYFATAKALNLTQQRMEFWISFDQFKATRDQIRDLETKCETGCTINQDKLVCPDPQEKMKSLEVK